MTAFAATEITDGLFYPEGPIALPDGDILVCELPTGNLVRIALDGRESTVAHTDGAPNGLAVGYDGRILIANNSGNRSSWDTGRPILTGTPDDYTGGSIQAVDLRTDDVETLATEVDGHPLASPNDLVVDSEGNLYSPISANPSSATG